LDGGDRIGQLASFGLNFPGSAAFMDWIVVFINKALRLYYSGHWFNDFSQVNCREFQRVGSIGIHRDCKKKEVD
jgi:hypothetical protein